MAVEDPTCETEEHGSLEAGELIDPVACRQAAEIFRALGESSRLQLLCLLMQGEKCVTELAELLDDNMPAVSQRLKLLRSERIVTYRREGKHVFYSLADGHVKELIVNAIAHASE